MNDEMKNKHCDYCSCLIDSNLVEELNLVSLGEFTVLRLLIKFETTKVETSSYGSFFEDSQCLNFLSSSHTFACTRSDSF